MEPFQFRLERLHELKDKLLEERERELGVIVSECNLLKQRKENCHNKLLSMRQIESFRQQELYRMKLIQDMKNCDDMLAVKQPALDEARRNFQKALQEKKVFDKLKEKKKIDYKKQKNRHEIKQLDNFAGNLSE